MTDPGVARVAALFDALAETYDGVGVDFFVPISAGLVAANPPVPGETWWDIGCGRGAVVAHVVDRIGPQGRILASDVSARMVASTAARARREGWRTVEVFVDDALHPDISRGPVDTISSCLVLFFVPQPKQALRAWWGLLRPGGRLAVTTFGAADPGWASVDALFVPYLPPALLDARRSGAQGPFASDAAMERLVEVAGFDEVRTVSGDVPVRFTDAEQWYAFSWSTGQRAWWQCVPEAERPRLRAQAEEILAEHAGPDGSITFTQHIRHTLAARPG